MIDINGRDVVGRELEADREWHERNKKEWPCSTCYVVWDHYYEQFRPLSNTPIYRLFGDGHEE